MSNIIATGFNGSGSGLMNLNAANLTGTISDARGNKPTVLLWFGLAALFLALTKRRHELVLLADGATSHRPILQEYSPYLLDQMIAAVTASTLVAYAFSNAPHPGIPGSERYALGAGDEVEWDGRPIRMSWPADPAPLWMAAEGPRTLAAVHLVVDAAAAARPACPSFRAASCRPSTKGRWCCRCSSTPAARVARASRWRCFSSNAGSST